MRFDWPAVQIAGVHDLDEAQLVAGAGAGYLGFPLRLPVHRPDLAEAQAGAVIAALPLSVRAVLITYLDRAADIREFAAELGVGIVQLHGPIGRGELTRLRSTVPELGIIKSLVVGSDDPAALLDDARDQQALVDAFITDTFDPATGASGATGQTHDWRVSRRLVEALDVPVILAGGLTPENVRDAILAVRPAGVDAHTGVEGASGRKDADRVRRFVVAAMAAFAEAGTTRTD